MEPLPTNDSRRVAIAFIQPTAYIQSRAFSARVFHVQKGGAFVCVKFLLKQEMDSSYFQSSSSGVCSLMRRKFYCTPTTTHFHTSNGHVAGKPRVAEQGGNPNPGRGGSVGYRTAAAFSPGVGVGFWGGGAGNCPRSKAKAQAPCSMSWFPRSSLAFRSTGHQAPSQEPVATYKLPPVRPAPARLSTGPSAFTTDPDRAPGQFGFQRPNGISTDKSQNHQIGLFNGQPRAGQTRQEGHDGAVLNIHPARPVFDPTWNALPTRHKPPRQSREPG